MIRSGFKPRIKPLSGILRTASLPVTIKPRKCKICRTPFVPRNLMRDKWCSPDCGAQLALRLVAAKKTKADRADRADTRARKEAIKTIPKLKAEAQIAFNAFIRARDAGKPCICCGNWPLTGGSLTGGSWDAAHYRSRGSADHLRYDENNVHRALKNCNEYGHEDYRGGLVARIGLPAVEALEANHALVKWTADGLREIRDRYRAKLKQLQADLKGAPSA
jgi:hypothetical protein